MIPQEEKERVEKGKLHQDQSANLKENLSNIKFNTRINELKFTFTLFQVVILIAAVC